MRAHDPFRRPWYRAALLAAAILQPSAAQSHGAVLFMHDLPGLAAVYSTPAGAIACDDPALTPAGQSACDYFRLAHNRAPVASDLARADSIVRAHIVRSIKRDKHIQREARTMQQCEEAGDCFTIHFDPR